MKKLTIKYISRTYGIEKDLELLLDDDDYEQYKNTKFNIVCNLGSSHYYFRIHKGGKYHYLHRMLMNDPPRVMEVDHINGNTLDNRKSNLRLASRGQNAQNVNWGPDAGIRELKGSYVITVDVDHVRYTGGPFLSLQEAREARKKLTDFLHQDFSVYKRPVA